MKRSTANLKAFDLKPENYFNRSRPEMLQFIPADAKTALDVGCSEGFFGMALKDRQAIEVWGVEKEPAIGIRAASHLDRVLIGDVYELLPQLPLAYFDCIIFNDVLEHLVDPYSVLETIKKNLKPNGVVVCSIPNIRNFHALVNLVIRRQWRYTDHGVMDKTHLRFFTQESIREMFALLDYDVMMMRGIHPVRNRIAKLIGFVTLGYHSDILYQQFACQVKLRSSV